MAVNGRLDNHEAVDTTLHVPETHRAFFTAWVTSPMGYKSVQMPNARGVLAAAASLHGRTTPESVLDDNMLADFSLEGSLDTQTHSQSL